MPPRVSVIMPVFNEEKLLGRAVDSILNQTYGDFELVIVDDGSTDRTWDVIGRLTDPRVRAVRAERSGFTSALNHAMREARGEYFARMDADDESLPTRLEKQVGFLDSHPDISVLGTAYYKYDALRHEAYIRSHPASDAEIRKAMPLYIPICHGSVMFRRQVFDVVGGYDEEIPDAEDLEYWLRVAPHFRFANLPDALYVYWFNPTSSYFETSLGRLRRVRNGMALNFRAIRVLNAPWYYYGIVIGKALYHFGLPSGLKRVARRKLSRSNELAVDYIAPDHGG